MVFDLSLGNSQCSVTSFCGHYVADVLHNFKSKTIYPPLQPICYISEKVVIFSIFPPYQPIV